MIVGFKILLLIESLLNVGPSFKIFCSLGAIDWCKSNKENVELDFMFDLLMLLTLFCIVC